MLKSFFLPLIIVLCATYGCKKDDDTSKPATQLLNLSGTTWKFYTSPLGSVPGTTYIKFNSNQKFDYSEAPDDDPIVYFGVWDQSVNNVNLHFETGYNTDYSGTLVNKDSISGTMFDSVTMTHGAFSAIRYR